MADIVKQILARPIQLADQVTKAADEASSFKQDCSELKSKTEKLAALLRQAARAGSDLYERPTRRIVDEAEQVLDRALSLVLKCRSNGLVKRVFTIIPGGAFRKTSSLLDNSVGDVSWLLRVVSGAAGDNDNDDGGGDLLGLPPIAANEPILCLIWEQIAILCTASPEDRSDAAASLVSLAGSNHRYGKLIIEEGGVGPLLKLVKEGKAEGQEHAARAVGLLARDPESAEHIIEGGACSAFAKVLKEGPMKVQSVVAWAVSEIAAINPKCQDLFFQNNITRLLVGHLAFETVQEHSKYNIFSNKVTSIHAAVMASNANANPNPNPNHVTNDEKEGLNRMIPLPLGDKSRNQLHRVVTSTVAMHAAQQQQQGNGGHLDQNDLKSNNGVLQGHHYWITVKGRELEDPKTKATMKEMAARALWHLAKGNSSICRSITESRALLCFAVLLERGPEAVQFNSAMAVMEIAAVAEKDPELRRSAFKPNSPACKAVVDQVLKIIQKADSDLLIPCIKVIGSLARTFRATETRMIGPLVKLIDEREAEVTREALISLTKFACSENYLHLDHSKAIISAGGVKPLIQLVYFGDHIVKVPSLVLLAYIALHVPDSQELAQAQVLGVLEWASKHSSITLDETLEALLLESKSRLDLYQSRGSRGFHKLHH